MIEIFGGLRSFETKIRNFADEIYALNETDTRTGISRNTHLYNLLYSLLEIGTGSVRKLQDLARLTSTLDGTRFGDLDLIFGGIFDFRRFPEEQYSYDPFLEPLTTDQWDEVFRKDAQYRERIKKFMQSLMRGGTAEGLAMAAEAACAFPCDCYELWRKSANLGLEGSTLGRLGNAKEFVIVPKLIGTNTLDPRRRRAIYQVLERLKPANTICTVNDTGLNAHTVISVRKAYSDSEYFEIRKFVTGVNVPPAPAENKYYWIKDGEETEVKTLAHLQTLEDRWVLNESITSVVTFKMDNATLQRPLWDAGTNYPAEYIVDWQGSYWLALRANINSQPQLGNPNWRNLSLPSRLQEHGQQWGPWREIERADAPENFPSGKYPNNQAKYNESGAYVFDWPSQAAYESWFSQVIDMLGGQREANRYRLPLSLEIIPGAGTAPQAALAPPEISVTSPYYGGF